MKITATIIALNEADNIRAACESVAWADEIIVVDSGSSDDTPAIAEACGARVLTNPWPGFSKQKQFAVDQASHDWIFSLDADERVSPQLRASIREVCSLNNPQRADGFRVARRAFYMGRWIRGGGWYPDYQLRLFHRGRGRWNDRIIHESVTMDADARVSTLKGVLLHYSMKSPEHHRQMIDERYAPLGAEQMHREGQRPSALRRMTAGPAAFVRSYVLKAGFRDGAAGWIIARMAAHNAALKHRLLQKLEERESSST